MTKDEFREVIIGNYLLNKDIVLVNIGTHKYIGDSFGPLLGSMLEGQLSVIKSYGTLNDTINGVNLQSRMQLINIKHKNDLIIGTDCSLSENEENIGKDFALCDYSFQPGLGVDKNHLPDVGQMSIQFCIRKTTEDPFEILKKPTIKEIYNRTRKAAEFIFDLDNDLYAINRNSNNNRQGVK